MKLRYETFCVLADLCIDEVLTGLLVLQYWSHILYPTGYWLCGKEAQPVLGFVLTLEESCVLMGALTFAFVLTFPL